MIKWKYLIIFLALMFLMPYKVFGTSLSPNGSSTISFGSYMDSVSVSTTGNISCQLKPKPSGPFYYVYCAIKYTPSDCSGKASVTVAGTTRWYNIKKAWSNRQEKSGEYDLPHNNRYTELIEKIKAEL